MSNELRDRMQRGEALTALALDANAPVGAVLRSVKRRRAVRASAVAAFGIVAVGSAAVGASAAVDGWSNAPAATSGPDTTASTLPPEPGISQGVTDPGTPSMVPVDTALVAQYLNPVNGPALVTGTMPATSEYGDAASQCGETPDTCDHPQVQALTPASLSAADERWAVALYSQAWSGGGPGSTGGGGGAGPAGIYLVGPDGQAAFVAAGDPAEGPISTSMAARIAWAPGRESAVVAGSLSSDGDPGTGGFTLVELLSGDATTVFGECGAAQAVAQDDGWLLRASCPEGPVAAVVSDSGELVTTDGLLVADDGFAVNVGASYLVAMHENDGAASAYYALTPTGDARIDGSSCFPTDAGRDVVCTEGEALIVYEFTSDNVAKVTDDPQLEGSPDLEICTVGDIEVRRIGQYDDDNVSQILVWPSGEQVNPDPLSNSQYLTCTSAGGDTGYFSGSGGVWSVDSTTLSTTRVLAAPDEVFPVTEDWPFVGSRVIAASVVVGGPSFLSLG